MFFVTYHRVDFIGFGVDLLQIILKFLDFLFHGLNVLEIGVSNRAGLSFALIVHSESHCFDYGFKLELNNENIYVFVFLIFNLFGERNGLLFEIIDFVIDGILYH